HDQYVVQVEQVRHRLQVGLDVVGQLVEERAIDGQRVDVAVADGVAVGRGALDQRDADVAGGARAVFDDYRGAQVLGQLVGDQPRQHVGRAAGGGRDDEVDRFVGPGMGAGDESGGQRQGGDAASQCVAHIGFPLC